MQQHVLQLRRIASDEFSILQEIKSERLLWTQIYNG